jgi:hypothetical protein
MASSKKTDFIEYSPQANSKQHQPRYKGFEAWIGIKLCE